MINKIEQDALMLTVHVGTGETPDGIKFTMSTNAHNMAFIVEFEDKQIEALQEEVAHRLGFHVVSHNLDMYGYCSKCRKGRG